MARKIARKSKTKGVKLPVPNGTVIHLHKIGSRISANTPEGKDVTSLISPNARRKAFDSGMNLQLIATKTGGYQFRQTAPVVHSVTTETIPLDTQIIGETVSEPDMTHEEVVDFIKTSPLKRPMNLVIPDIKWKYLVRSALRGENILLLGPSGTGKTLAVKCLQSVMQRPTFYFNLGSTQDPRSSLIGNTHFNKESGTFFDQALFVSAIQTPNSIILLDELSRAHPDAWNILMTVLDKGQRYLRLDEKAGSPTINVAKGVTFIATANIGSEYTSTRTMDRALLDRFITVEMEHLDKDSETELLKYMFPNVNEDKIRIVTEIANHTREQSRLEDPKVSLALSTRMTVEMTSLLYDGFGLQEVADVCIYPFFSNVGGLESERTYMKQYVQKHIPVDVDPNNNFLNDAGGNDSTITF